MTQQTGGSDLILLYCWANVADGIPTNETTLYHCLVFDGRAVLTDTIVIYARRHVFNASGAGQQLRIVGAIKVMDRLSITSHFLSMRNKPLTL